MQEKKGKVNWTLDAEVIQAIKQKAQKMSQETGVKISESAAANLLLKAQIEKENGK